MNKKTVFITGGSRGIGRACVNKFFQEGWRVAFTYNNEREASEELARELGEENAVCLRLNLEEDSSQVSKAIKEAKVYFGVSSFDALVVNAGMSISGDLSVIDEGDMEHLIKVNLTGAMNTLRFAAEDLIKEKKGSVVLISSMWGLRGASCESIYSATKAGLIGFGRSMALELAPSNIRVNMVAPGVIDTDMNKGYSEEEIGALSEATPLGRLGRPEEVADGVYFLASENSSFITGQVLTIDGGITV